jgi:cell division septation protein DedD
MKKSGGIMRLIRLFTVILLAAALVSACSEKQKEAARLEEEMKNQEGAADTMAEAQTAETDTLKTAPVTKPGAVPQETKPAAEAMPPAPPGEGYTVQVASCEDAAYARHLVNLYRERGFEPYVTQYTLDGQLYYRVRVGNVPTYAQARAIKQELESKYSVSAWIDTN